MNGIERLHSIMTRLRDPEKGCPWDRVQTLESLKPCVLEEAYELLAAMDAPEDKAHHIEELGDVLLQVMFQCVMAEQEGRFTFDDVANAISDKLVRRHPHVFGDATADNPEAVLKNWEQIKQLEHRKDARHSALDGVPPTLPALLKAQRTAEKAARVGFDWAEAADVVPKIHEEMGELADAVANGEGDARVKEELGDLLFAVANYARHLHVDAESALEGTSAKFAKRFRFIEAAAKAQGRELKSMTMDEREELWRQAKKQ
ncbi:MAG: nucleoside triphosphate pyrophosphohydrolase [Kiritimatiellae bacterium]|nr:nucleoside triphosphate pyrophosphohydrolase [Kiritimatiellia bacterium]